MVGVAATTTHAWRRVAAIATQALSVHSLSHPPMLRRCLPNICNGVSPKRFHTHTHTHPSPSCIGIRGIKLIMPRAAMNFAGASAFVKPSARCEAVGAYSMFIPLLCTNSCMTPSEHRCVLSRNLSFFE